MSGIEVLPHNADRDDWLAERRKGIGASEIAAVMGISPWDSPFSLWWHKHMGWETPDNPEMMAGRRLEPVIADWFAEQFVDGNGEMSLMVRPAGLYRNADREWQLATPDRLLMLPVQGRPSVFRCGALLECKAAFSWEGWGYEGTSEIPVHYRAQALWQMDTVGVDLVHVAAFAGLHFRRFLVRRDEKDLRAMRFAGERFMESLAEGEPPDVDGHSATLSTLRRVHAFIEDREQEIPARVAANWLRAKTFTARAKKVEARHSAVLRSYLGTAKTAVCDGIRVASRTSDDKLKRMS